MSSGLLTPEIPIVTIPVSDRRIGDTIIKQKATSVGLDYKLRGPYGPSVVLMTEVRMYAPGATQPDGFGPELVGDGIFQRNVALVANNDTLIDAATGVVLAQRRREPQGGLPAHTEETWQAEIRSFPQPCILQGTAFCHTRAYEQINIDDLILHHMEAADRAPFNRFR